MRLLAPTLVLALTATAGAQELPLERDVWLGDSFVAQASAMAVSPVGSVVACVTRDGVDVRGFAGETWQRLESRGAQAAAWSPDGRLLAVATRRAIDAFDTTTWRVVRSWESEGADAIAFVSTDRVVWSNPRRVASGQVRPRAPVDPFDLRGGFTALVVSRAGTHVAGVDPVGRAVVWEAATGRRVLEVGDGVSEVVFTPDGADVLLVRRDGAHLRRRVLDGAAVPLPAAIQRARIRDACFVGDRSLLVLGDHGLAEHDLGTGEVVRSYAISGAREIEYLRDVAVAPDGTVLGRGGWVSAVVVWRPEETSVRVARVFQGNSPALTFTPAGELVALSTLTTSVWQVSPTVTCRSFRMRMFSSSASPLRAACSRDGRWVALVAPDEHMLRVLELVDLRSGESRSVWHGLATPVDVCAGAGEASFFVGDVEGGLLEVDGVSGGPARELKGLRALGGRCRPLAASGVLLLAGARPRPELRSSETLEPRGVLDLEPSAAVRSAAIAPDGRLAALAVATGEVVVFDASTGERVAAFTPYAGYVWGLAFTGDGALLLTIGPSSSVAAWDPRTGASVGHLSLEGTPESLLAAPTGRRLAVRLATGRVRVIDLAD